jgi:catechol 2,3-dioxygenase-like lactoylglutathione lyase family enzyme
VTLAPYFHVGILVPDLKAAMERFSTVLGLDFADPAEVRVDQLEQPWGSAPFDVLLSYSVQGPPHIELLEATGDGVYGLHSGVGLHHIGAWTADADASIESLVAKGMRAEAIFRGADETLGAFFDPGPLAGVRYEVSPLSIKPEWAAWIRGEGTLGSSSFDRRE